MSGFDYTSEYFLDISRRCQYNEKIAKFYELMSEMKYDELFPLFERDQYRVCYSPDYAEMCKYGTRAKYLRSCMRTGWESDYFRLQGVKIVTRVNRCRDRFCYNCQSMDAMQRYLEYAPVIDVKAKELNADVYHVVFTQPNVPAFLLKSTLDLMQEAFRRLVAFMTGQKKIKGFDLVGEYGLLGGVRALEVARNDNDNYYHPHYHCMFIMRKGIDVTPKYFNSFSRDYTHRKEDRYFSDLEIFLQRIWYLLINRIKVTKKNLELLPQFSGAKKSYPDGFSCYAENAQGRYHEVFKYCTKGSYKNGSILEDFECFRALHDALFKRHIYQSFGCLYGINMNVVHEEIQSRDISDLCFNEMLEKFKELEDPVHIVEDLNEILKQTVRGDKVRYISLQSIRSAFADTPPEERENLKAMLLKVFWIM